MHSSQFWLILILSCRLIPAETFHSSCPGRVRKIRFLKGKHTMNIYDISEKAGVSIATVSRVLNNSPKVRPSTREKVLRIMEENGYTPNAFARSLGLNSMFTVGILCSDVSDPYQAQAVSYLERELRNHSYASMLCCTGYELKEKQKSMEFLLSRNVDAVFLTASHFVERNPEDQAYLLAAADKVPVFVLNGELSGTNIYSIFCDDYRAVFTMTSHLLTHGSSAPLYLYRRLNHSGQKKLHGFLDACRRFSVSHPERRVFGCQDAFPAAVSLLSSLRNSGLHFDAVQAADDELAACALKYAQQQQLPVPGQFQIAGYNASDLSVLCTPSITTVDNRVEYLCTTAAELLFQLLEGKQIPSRTCFSGELLFRDTTC